MKKLHALLITIASCWLLFLPWLPTFPPHLTPETPWIDRRPDPWEIELYERTKTLEYGSGVAILGLSIVGLIREVKVGRLLNRVELGASPNGGPTTPSGNSGVTEEPPSVS